MKADVELAFAAHYNASDGKWGPALAGSSASAAASRVVMNAAGDAIALWTTGGICHSGPTSKVLVARETAEGGLGAPLQLNKDRAYGPAPGRPARGRAFAAWVEGPPYKLIVARFE